ncbi:MAG: hypothetical protein KCHDKBKB_02911 [Elusimicrobia bacterium]|nr:hypothetical protein [Elusimicrobiota bacterium]
MILGRKIVLWVTALVASGTFLFTATAFFGLNNWPLELTSHFRVQYLIIQTACLLIFVALKNRAWVITTLGVGVINFALVYSWGFSFPSVMANTPPQPTLKILQINLNIANRDVRRVSQLINASNADIVGLEELTGWWLDALKPTLETYAHQKVETQEGCFGIGLFSRVPLDKATIKRFSRVDIPTVLASIKLDGRAIDIIHTHPLPPGNPETFAIRNEQLENIGNYRKELGKTLIVMGDLNVSPWSPHFQRLIKKMDLQDTRKGFGIQPSWPTMLPILRTPIDHFLVSKDLVTIKRKVGPNVSSDHYPVYVELALKENGME